MTKPGILPLLVPATASVLLSSCDVRLTRSAYSYDAGGRDKRLVILHGALTSDSLEYAGTLDVGEYNYTFRCAESDVIREIRKEAKLVSADVASVYDEKRPGKGSTCFRCRVTFYRYKFPGMRMSDSGYYADDAVAARENKDERRSKSMVTAAIATGLVGGFVLGYLLFR